MNLSQLNRILLQTLLLPVVALLLVSGALIWQIGNAQKTVNDLQDADRNIATATYILAMTVDEESGLRGFQNTSNEAFLQPFQKAQLSSPPASPPFARTLQRVARTLIFSISFSSLTSAGLIQPLFL